MKVNSRWRAGPRLLFTNLQGNRKMMDRILSSPKIRKCNIPRVPLIYPQIQSGKSFLFSKLFVEFLFYKHSLSKFIGIFNVLKLSFHFWPQPPLFPDSSQKFETCSFPAPFTLQRSFFPSFLLCTEITCSSYNSPWVSPLCSSFWPPCNVYMLVSMCGTEQTNVYESRSQHCLLHGNAHHHHT